MYPAFADTVLGEAETEICVQENNAPLAATAASVDIHHETVVDAPLSFTFPFKVALVVAIDVAVKVVAVGGPTLIVILKVADAVLPAESVT